VQAPNEDGSARLKVLVASINFAPDHAGIGVYATDFPVFLAEQGDAVSMVTGFSYYPRWRKRPEDAGRLFAREQYRGVDVLRGYLHVPRTVTPAARLWHELTFCAFAAVNFFRAGRPDVIALFTPPIFLGLLGVLLGKWWRCPVVINVQDLPLDGALALGLVRRNPPVRLLQQLEGWVYRHADQVCTISPGMLKRIEAKGVPPERLHLVPNWIDLSAAKKAAVNRGWLTQHAEAAGKFTVVYAGNLGVKQGVDLLLRAAAALANEPAVHFFVIGDGADRARLTVLADQLRLRNCTFLPWLETEEYEAMLTDVDVVFVTQRSGAGNNFFPSKLLGVMAAAKPMLAAADDASELAHVVREAQCGLVSPWDDAAQLVANLRVLQQSDARAAMGQRGRIKVKDFERGKILFHWREQIAGLRRPGGR
jgi:colanic acid biosynthesis glycosyl transferase WcaI